jgi:hypothetical protein
VVPRHFALRTLRVARDELRNLTDELAARRSLPQATRDAVHQASVPLQAALTDLEAAVAADRPAVLPALLVRLHDAARHAAAVR